MVAPISRSQAEIIDDNLRLKPIINVAFSRVSIPLASPLTRGTLKRILSPLIKRNFEKNLVPPLLRGVRGDRDLDKNKRDGGFDVKLSPMGRV